MKVSFEGMGVKACLSLLILIHVDEVVDEQSSKQQRFCQSNHEAYSNKSTHRQLMVIVW